MTPASGKADGGTGVPDGIDLDAQIIHARGIYEGDCETFGKQSQWAIKSGSILASLFELKDARGKSCGVVSEEMITAYLNAQAKSVHEAESNFQLIRPRKHCAEGLRAALSFTPAANGPGEAGWLPIESAPKDGREVILRRDSRISAGCWIAERDVVAAEFHATGAYLGQYPTGEVIGGSWTSLDGGFTDESPPTHWTKLPDFSPSTPQPGVVTVPREDALDARRYRWLRDRTKGGRYPSGVARFELPSINAHEGIFKGSVAQHMDDAIDSAIRQLKEKA